MKSSTMPIMIRDGRNRVVFLDEETKESYIPSTPTPCLSWSRTSVTVILLAGIVACLSAINLGITVAAVKNSKDVIVDADGYLVSSKTSNQLVSARTTGKAFELEVVMDKEMSTRSFACVGE